MNNQVIVEGIKNHHSIYRHPVKALQWEDIFDRALNGPNSDWNSKSHSTGADVVDNSSGLRYQNKSGIIDLKNNILLWNGHRTTKYKDLESKLNFITKKKYDVYCFLARDKKFEENNKYYYIQIPVEAIDYSSLNWEETKQGFEGSSENIKAKIVRSMSDQLWTYCNFDFIKNNSINYKEIKIE